MMADIDPVINCGICSKIVDTPEILPCFHTICKKCLESIVKETAENGHFECSICRKETPSPGDEDEKNSRLNCDACCRTHSAVYKCTECSQNFCMSCGYIHKRMSSSRFHTLISISPEEKNTSDKKYTKLYCETHQFEQVTEVCKDCDKLICIACIPVFHKGHSCNTISLEAEEKRGKMRELISVSENNLTEMVKDTRVVKRQAESKYKYFNEQISELRKTKDVIITKINKKYKAYEEKITQLNDEQLVLSEQMNNTQEMTNAKFNRILENSRDILENSEDILFLKNYGSTCNELSEINSDLVSAVSGKSLMESVEQCTTWLVNLDQ